MSAHALGTGSPRHQSMGDEVAGLEVVLADGTCLRTGSAAAQDAGFFHRYCLGPDLTGLFVGADSTLGVITAVALWLHPLPQWRDTLCVGFADYPAAARYIEALQQREWTRDIWYGAGYDAMAVRGRLGEPQPQDETAQLPRLVLGLDLGADTEDGPRLRQRLVGLAGEHGGALGPAARAARCRRVGAVAQRCIARRARAACVGACPSKRLAARQRGRFLP